MALSNPIFRSKSTNANYYHKVYNKEFRQNNGHRLSILTDQEANRHEDQKRSKEKYVYSVPSNITDEEKQNQDSDVEIKKFSPQNFVKSANNRYSNDQLQTSNDNNFERGIFNSLVKSKIKPGVTNETNLNKTFDNFTNTRIIPDSKDLTQNVDRSNTKVRNFDDVINNMFNAPERQNVYSSASVAPTSTYAPSSTGGLQSTAGINSRTVTPISDNVYNYSHTYSMVSGVTVRNNMDDSTTHEKQMSVATMHLNTDDEESFLTNVNSKGRSSPYKPSFLINNQNIYEEPERPINVKMDNFISLLTKSNIYEDYNKKIENLKMMLPDNWPGEDCSGNLVRNKEFDCDDKYLPNDKFRVQLKWSLEKFAESRF